MAFAFIFVVRFQPFSQPMRLDARDGVPRRIERTLGSTQDFGRNVVLIDLVDSVLKISLRNISQEFLETRSVRECC